MSSMAASSSPFSLNLISPPSTADAISSHPFSLSLYFLSHKPSSRFKFHCINQPAQLETLKIHPQKKRRKPRPSFSDQVLEKWSCKPTSRRETFPWQKAERRRDEREGVLAESGLGGDDSVSFGSVKTVKLAPWVQKTGPRKQNLNLDDGNPPKDHGNESLASESVSFDHSEVKNSPKVSHRGQIDHGVVLPKSRIGNKSLVSDSGSFDHSEVKNWRKDIDRGQVDHGAVLPKSRIGNKSLVSFDHFDVENWEKDSDRSQIDHGVEALVSDSESFDHSEVKDCQKDSDRAQIDHGIVQPKSRIAHKSPLISSNADYFEVENSRKGHNRGQIDEGAVSPKSRIAMASDSVGSGHFEAKNSQTDGGARESDGGYGRFERDFDGEHRIEIGFVEEEEDERGLTMGDESQSTERPPWEGDDGGEEGLDVFKNRTNTPLAERLIPELELRRLRNKAGRLAERFRAGAAGVTQELVDSIHEKWRKDEVVKLKFKGPSALNMKRTHETLESKTGGLVIFRSGSSVVLFRGMAYELPCVQSFAKLQTNESSRETGPNGMSTGYAGPNGPSTGHVGPNGLSTSYAGRYIKDLSEEELRDLEEFNRVLDGLGPRFKDWAGREPLPVDADLLPSVVEGYKRPFRLLPHGIRLGLRDRETTFFRRTARTMPPHFALGRNRELQGLAVAMVKLWERSAIAKIAIKRGVHNTCNERMAEELKRLTGGTLLSRNKDYIVFYRGNDFLPPNVTKTLTEAQELRTVQQEEEDKARRKAAALVEPPPPSGPLVAGTLAETLAATSRWGSKPSREEIEKMRRDAALARHASLVRFLEKKLALAKGKMKKAEKALAKVQRFLEPSELPTDLETLTDEERFSLRKIGLSMKPYLVLGRRGVFDGTIENMHLHWKYRELVKIMVERKSFGQVKQVAVALEAESGGVLVSVDRTTRGYVVIVYRGKNYERPEAMRPTNLLTRRQALARSIELQRREALKRHMSELQGRIQNLKFELEDTKDVDEIDEATLHARVQDGSGSDSDFSDDERDETMGVEDEAAYLETYDDGNETCRENRDG